MAGVLGLLHVRGMQLREIPHLIQGDRRSQRELAREASSCSGRSLRRRNSQLKAQSILRKLTTFLGRPGGHKSGSTPLGPLQSGYVSRDR